MSDVCVASDDALGGAPDSDMDQHGSDGVPETDRNLESGEHLFLTVG
jgi:hypothetical protein